MKNRVFFWIILFFALILRVISISSIPAGINQDEAMLAVDAWALSKYGTDRFGMYMPVHFTAWGFGQMSVLLGYLMVPFIKVLGFTTFAVRLPMALVSTLGVALVYLIAERIFTRRLALGMMLLTAVNPWHFMQSRWALDCNLFPHVFLIGVYLLLVGMEKRRYLYLSMVFFGLTFYCYGVAVYTVPVFLLIFAVWCLWKRYLAFKEVLLSLVVFMVVALPEVITMVINVFGWSTIETPFFTMPYFPYSVRGDDILLMNFSWEQLQRNGLALWRQVFLQYPDWLHNAMPEYGPMYPISLPFILIGVGRFVSRALRKPVAGKAEATEVATAGVESAGVALLLMLLMSLWSGLITKEVNINRINIIFYPLIMFCGYGVSTAASWFKGLGKRAEFAAVAVVVGLYSVWACGFFVSYFTQFPQHIRRQFHEDFVEIVKEADEMEAYDVLYITENLGWNHGRQLAEILTQYSCQIDAAYYQGRTNTNGPRELLPYAERYRYVDASAMAVAMSEDELVDEKRLYIVYKGELEQLPAGGVAIAQAGDYLLVER